MGRLDKLTQIAFFFEAERGKPITKSIEIEPTSKWEFPGVAIHPQDADALL